MYVRVEEGWPTQPPEWKCNSPVCSKHRSDDPDSDSDDADEAIVTLSETHNHHLLDSIGAAGRSVDCRDVCLKPDAHFFEFCCAVIGQSCSVGEALKLHVNFEGYFACKGESERDRQ